MRLSVSLLLLAASPTAFAAEDQSEVSYALQLPALSVMSETSSTTIDGGEETKSKTNTTIFAEHSDAAYLGIFLGSWSFYFYPLADINLLSAGYWVTDSVEVGINIGGSNVKVDKPKDEMATNGFGLYAGYLCPIVEEKVILETYLSLDNVTTKGVRDLEAGGQEKTNQTEGILDLSVEAAVNLAKGVHYVGGIGVVVTNYEDKEAKEKSKIQELSLNLASIRITM